LTQDKKQKKRAADRAANGQRADEQDLEREESQCMEDQEMEDV